VSDDRFNALSSTAHILAVAASRRPYDNTMSQYRVPTRNRPTQLEAGFLGHPIRVKAYEESWPGCHIRRRAGRFESANPDDSGRAAVDAVVQLHEIATTSTVSIIHNYCDDRQFYRLQQYHS